MRGVIAFVFSSLVLGSIAALAQVGLPFPGPGTAHSAGGIAPVGGHGGLTQNAGSGTTQAATITGTSAANFITVGIFWCDDVACGSNNGVVVSGVTSSAGETCTQATGAANTAAASNYSTDIWYCKNIVGGNDTITATFSGTVNYAAISVQEWTGVSTTAPDDGVGNKNASASATSLSAATNGNTTVSGELIYSMGAAGTALTPGQTVINSNGAGNLKDEYQISGAAGSYTDSWTQASANQFSTSVAAFKP